MQKCGESHGLIFKIKANTQNNDSKHVIDYFFSLQYIRAQKTTFKFLYALKSYIQHAYQ